jgi:mannose-6-phosphate isomerase
VFGRRHVPVAPAGPRRKEAFTVQPIPLEANQVGRFYLGGPAISEFRGIPGAGDRVPEDWVGSATSVFGSQGTGITVLPDGRTLPEALSADPEAFVGRRHAERYGANPGLLVKLLDAGQRLPIHCHPDRAFARRHLDCPWGKTEAWVIAEVRLPDPVVFLGFRHDVDLPTLSGWVASQETSVMLDAMNRLPVAAGDAVLVPAGVPHAIGEGIFLVELQEPTDLSVLLEWAGFDVDGPRDGHLGLGFDLALRCVDRGGWDRSAIDRVRGAARGRDDRPGVEVLLPQEADPFFRAERIRPADASPLPAGFSVLVVTGGRGRLETASGAVLELRRGATVLIPHAAGDCALTGAVEAVRCLPPDPDAPDDPAPTVR